MLSNLVPIKRSLCDGWHAYGINFNHVLLTSKVHIGFVLFCFSYMFFNV